MHNCVSRLFQIRVARPLALLLWQFESALTGCHISPRVKLPADLDFPHPTGIVIGDGVTLGARVTIYQGVTIGVRRKGLKEYPRVGDGVTVYAGAVIVGGIRLANGSVLGANAFVSRDTIEGEKIAPCSANT